MSSCTRGSSAGADMGQRGNRGGEKGETTNIYQRQTTRHIKAGTEREVQRWGQTVRKEIGGTDRQRQRQGQSYGLFVFRFMIFLINYTTKDSLSFMSLASGPGLGLIQD